MNAVDNNDEPPLMYRTHDAQSKRKHPSRNYNQHLWINSPSKEPHIDRYYFFLKKTVIFVRSLRRTKISFPPNDSGTLILISGRDEFLWKRNMKSINQSTVKVIQ